MKKKSKLLFLIIIAYLIPSIFIISNLDWSQNWMISIGMLFFLLLVIISIIDIKQLIYILLFLFPTIIYFNDLKINPAKISIYLGKFDFPINLTSLLVIYSLILGIILVIYHIKKLRTLPLKYILLLYSIFLTLSIFWSKYFSDSIIGLVYFFTPFAFYIISFLYFKSKEDLIKINYFVILSSVLPILISIHQFFTNSLFYEDDSHLGRIRGTFVHPNLFGLYLFIILAVSVSIALSKKNKSFQNNIYLYSYSLIVFIVFILTYSRVSWIVLAIFIFLTAIRKKILLLLMIILSPIVITISLMISTIRMRVLEIFNGVMFSSWIARKNIWIVATNEFQNKKIIGHGVGTSEAVIDRAKTWRGGTSLPHNDYILYLVETGIIGLLLYLSIVFGAIINTFKSYTKMPDIYEKIKSFHKSSDYNFKIYAYSLSIILISLLFASMFESTSRRIVVQSIIWTILGSVFAISTSNDKK